MAVFYRVRRLNLAIKQRIKTAGSLLFNLILLCTGRLLCGNSLATY
jgi:hypothetical protein